MTAPSYRTDRLDAGTFAEAVFTRILLAAGSPLVLPIAEMSKPLDGSPPIQIGAGNPPLALTGLSGFVAALDLFAVHPGTRELLVVEVRNKPSGPMLVGGQALFGLQPGKLAAIEEHAQFGRVVVVVRDGSVAPTKTDVQAAVAADLADSCRAWRWCSGVEAMAHAHRRVPIAGGYVDAIPAEILHPLHELLPTIPLSIPKARDPLAEFMEAR